MDDSRIEGKVMLAKFRLLYLLHSRFVIVASAQDQILQTLRNRIAIHSRELIS